MFSHKNPPFGYAKGANRTEVFFYVHERMRLLPGTLRQPQHDPLPRLREAAVPELRPS